MGISLNYSDFLAVTVLVVLYAIQGILLTIFTATLPMILNEMGFTISQLSYLNFTSYPFSLKILFAPFLDTYYNKAFGHRKTYIVPMNYIAGVLLIVSSYFVSDWIKNGNIIILSLLGIVLIFVIALQDIATDAWGIKIMSKKNISYVSLSQAIGMQFGFIYANTAYIQFNFHETTFFFYLGIFVVIFNVIIHFFIDEYGFNEEKKQIEMKEEEEEEKLIQNILQGQSEGTPDGQIKRRKRKDIGTLVRTMKGFYYNKNLRLLIALVIIQNFGVGPILSTFTLKIQKAGISKQRISMSQFYLFPIKSLATFIIAKYFKNTLKLGHTILIVQLGFQLIQFLFYQGQVFGIFAGNLEYVQICVLILIQLLDSLIITSLIQIRTTFYSTIATKGYEAIYITMLTSVQNVGRKWVMSSFQFFDDYLNFNYSVPILWIFQLFYVYYGDKVFKKMDQLDKKEWCLVETMDSHHQKSDKKKD